MEIAIFYLGISQSLISVGGSETVVLEKFKEFALVALAKLELLAPPLGF